MCGASTHAASPSLGNILPRGGARGTDVELQFIGGNLADAVDLLFAEPGITLKQSVSAADGEFKCVVTIAADCRMGRHPIWVRTASGISNLEIFSVGALTEIAEIEPNNEAATAQAVALGTTVNGVVTSEDVDYFAVELDTGAKLAAEGVELAGHVDDRFISGHRVDCGGGRGHRRIPGNQGECGQVERDRQSDGHAGDLGERPDDIEAV